MTSGPNGPCQGLIHRRYYLALSEWGTRPNGKNGRLGTRKQPRWPWRLRRLFLPGASRPLSQSAENLRQMAPSAELGSVRPTIVKSCRSTKETKRPLMRSQRCPPSSQRPLAQTCCSPQRFKSKLREDEAAQRNDYWGLPSNIAATATVSVNC
jgi:hypothetical protein